MISGCAAVRQGSIMPSRPSIRDLTSAVAELREELRRSRRENRKLRLENEVLRQAAQPLIHDAAARERFAFIHARFRIETVSRRLIQKSASARASPLTSRAQAAR
jgi:regulator of replication initiation timing